MRILFIGGTSFVGRHAADEAIARGHEVTLFHRGKTGAELFPEAEHVLGDRRDDLALLKGGVWDAAIDVCGYRPREVRDVADTIGGTFGTYCYISTADVYRRLGATVITEDSPLRGENELEDPATEDVTNESYGPLKALCEGVAQERFAGRALVVRPTYVVGPHDPTDRFTYWVRRAAAGVGEILAPDPPDAPAQLIDARDLGAFTIDLVERGAVGAYHGAGPAEPITFGRMVAACADALGTDTSITWVDPAFLYERDVDVEVELPLWTPPGEFEILRCDPAKSLAAGLRLRPIADTIRETAEWDRERGTPRLKHAILPDREAELLSAWRARS